MQPVRRGEALDEASQVSRWHQRLAVALDGPIEILTPGPERLPAVLAAYLDTQRATVVRPDSGPLFRALLVEDLRGMGAVDPNRAAADLLSELAGLVVLEDAAGRVLPALRDALLPRAPQPSARLRGWRASCACAGRRAARASAGMAAS